MGKVKAFLLPKGEKLLFFESFSSFPNKIDKNSKLRYFLPHHEPIEL